MLADIQRRLRGVERDRITLPASTDPLETFESGSPLGPTRFLDFGRNLQATLVGDDYVHLEAAGGSANDVDGAVDHDLTSNDLSSNTFMTFADAFANLTPTTNGSLRLYLRTNNTSKTETTTVPSAVKNLYVRGRSSKYPGGTLSINMGALYFDVAHAMNFILLEGVGSTDYRTRKSGTGTLLTEVWNQCYGMQLMLGSNHYAYSSHMNFTSTAPASYTVRIREWVSNEITFTTGFELLAPKANTGATIITGNSFMGSCSLAFATESSGTAFTGTLIFRGNGMGTSDGTAGGSVVIHFLSGGDNWGSVDISGNTLQSLTIDGTLGMNASGGATPSTPSLGTFNDNNCGVLAINVGTWENSSLQANGNRARGGYIKLSASQVIINDNTFHEGATTSLASDRAVLVGEGVGTGPLGTATDQGNIEITNNVVRATGATTAPSGGNVFLIKAGGAATKNSVVQVNGNLLYYHQVSGVIDAGYKAIRVLNSTQAHISDNCGRWGTFCQDDTAGAIAEQVDNCGQADVNPPPSINVSDEGIAQGTVNQFNFVGPGVSAAVAGSTATVTIPGASAPTFLQVAKWGVD